MLEQSTEDVNTTKDYVIGTGEFHSVREFLEIAFRQIGIQIRWSGVGVEEIGRSSIDSNHIIVKIDQKYFRPTEVEELLADPRKANQECRTTIFFSRPSGRTRFHHQLGTATEF